MDEKDRKQILGSICARGGEEIDHDIIHVYVRSMRCMLKDLDICCMSAWRRERKVRLLSMMPDL